VQTCLSYPSERETVQPVAGIGNNESPNWTAGTIPLDKTDMQKLRNCLGRFATGVMVVTCNGSEGPCGITANSFSSVSLEPPLILWNIAKVAHSLEAYLAAKHFAINILAADQGSLSHHFAQSDHTAFDGVPYEMSGNGVPLLPGTLACIECRTHAIHDCGDHHIIIGEIQQYRYDHADPLLFYAGEYARLDRKP
jgi:flavin reductase (DIM6/NTAB) family NADH-FMN oxidoreductase RutF